MSQADEFRANARECREFARTAKTVERRQIFLDMAAMWERCAAEQEGGAPVHGPAFQSPPAPVRQRRVG